MQQNQNSFPQRQFNCYFCNKLIQNETELGHTTICGNVLIPCPNRCGSYIPRMDLKRHKIDCINKITRSNNYKLSYQRNANFVENDSSSLDRKLLNRQAFDATSETLIRTQNELKKLSNKLAELEEKFLCSSTLLPQQIDLCKNLQVQQTLDLEKLKYFNEILAEWKKNVDSQLENFKQNLSNFSKSQTESSLHWMNLQQKLMILEKLQKDVRLQSEAFKNEQKCSRQVHLEFAQQLDEFKDWITQENAVIGSLWNDEKIEVERILTETEGLRKCLDELKAKYNNMIFDIKTVSQIASETAEKAEIQEREFRELKEQVRQITLDLGSVEEVASNRVGLSSNIPGRTLWKISDFAEKMQSAKDSNTVLKSPLFYSHEYGYKLRVLVYLNGLKKWKDHYALLSIYVMKGEYDQLLKWPCHIEGTVTLRDLENLDSPRNFSKFISAKYQCAEDDNEEPQESSSSYIFIPHTTLMKSTYLKDNVLLLDVRIDQINKFVSETLL